MTNFLLKNFFTDMMFQVSIQKSMQDVVSEIHRVLDIL